MEFDLEANLKFNWVLLIKFLHLYHIRSDQCFFFLFLASIILSNASLVRLYLFPNLSAFLFFTFLCFPWSYSLSQSVLSRSRYSNIVCCDLISYFLISFWACFYSLCYIFMSVSRFSSSESDHPPTLSLRYKSTVFITYYTCLFLLF